MKNFSIALEVILCLFLRLVSIILKISPKIIYILPIVYMITQVCLWIIGPFNSNQVPHFLIADGIWYSTVFLAYWCIFQKKNLTSLNYILGIVMVVSFFSSGFFKSVIDFLFAHGVIISIVFLTLLGSSHNSTSQESWSDYNEKVEKARRRKEEDEKHQQKVIEQHEEFVRKSTPKWVFEYAIDRGGLVEYVKFDENNPTFHREKSSFRGKLISYSSLTITVLDGNQTCIYYADGHRICRPALGN